MVATSGSGWKLAPSLIKLCEEFDNMYPRRSTASDGSIGDQSHRARASYHNPSGGYVHAVDITHDPKNGVDVHQKAREIAARKDSRIHDIISNGQRWTPTTGWRKYSGANKHTAHAHFGVKKTYEARRNVSPWLVHSTAPPTPAPNPSPSPAPAPKPVAKPPVNLPKIDLPKKEEQMMMKLFRDHTGAIWLWYPDGTRAHLTNPDEVRVWRENYGLEYMDLGPGSLFHNPIISAVWLNRIKQIA